MGPVRTHPGHRRKWAFYLESDTFASDFIFGTTGDDKICPVGCNYEVFANAGNDTLKGGAVRDTLVGYLGRDTLDSRDGVSGNDSFSSGLAGTAALKTAALKTAASKTVTKHP